MHKLQTHIVFTNLWSNMPRICVISSQRVKNGTRTPCTRISIFMGSNPIGGKIFFSFLLPFSMQNLITNHFYFRQNVVRCKNSMLFQFQNFKLRFQDIYASC